MPQILIFSLLFLILIWLIVVSFFLWKIAHQYTLLMGGTDHKTLQGILGNMLQDISKSKKDIQVLAKQYEATEKEGRSHIQKIGLLRFNPFKDTGGDQSFILTLVDAHDTGVIISGLYSRSGTRWYAKKVINGRSKEHDLSDEEKKALKLAQPINHQ